MNIFLKSTAGVLTALILWLTVNKHNKEISVMLTLAVSAMVVIAAITVFHPVIDFLHQVKEIGEIDSTYFSILLKVVGIGMISEICSIICKDAGNETLAKALQLMTSFLVLWLAIPVFEKLISLLDAVLEAIQ